MRRIKTVEIAGRVIGATGPVARAFIDLEPADANDSGFNLGGGRTDEKGSFRLRHIPEGTYYIGASQREEGTGNVAYRGRQKIEVAGDNIDSLTISLGAGTTIQGRVKVGGAKSVTLDRIRLSLMPVGEDGQWGGSGNVKNDGSFEIKSVPDGRYVFNASGDGFQSPRQTLAHGYPYV